MEIAQIKPLLIQSYSPHGCQGLVPVLRLLSHWEAPLPKAEEKIEKPVKEEPLIRASIQSKRRATFGTSLLVSRLPKQIQAFG